MKRSVLIILFMCAYHLSVCAQNTYTRNHIPSPEAYAFMQYEETPVSLYTGVPSISIPIYTIESGDYSLPISLNYHASGIKIAQEASWVGLGWSLSAGGSISRSIRGLDDFEGYLQQDYPVPTVEFSSDSLFFTVKDEYQYDGDFVNVEPDIFFYNFGNYSGKFYFVKSSVAKNEKKKVIFSKPEDNLKVDFFNPNCLEDGFIITTPENIKYKFSYVEYSWKRVKTYDDDKVHNPGFDPVVKYQLNEFDQKNYRTSWYLVRVEYPTGDVIGFDYALDGYLSPMRQSRQNLYILDKKEFDEGIRNVYGKEERKIFNPQTDTLSLDIASMEYSKIPRLKSISWKNGYLQFNENTIKREDIRCIESEAKRLKSLSSIQLFQNGDSNPLLTYSFDYSYFYGKNMQNVVPRPDTLNNYLTYRLKLRNMYVKGRGNTSQKYSMEYDESEPLPQKNSFSCDKWGYYNGSSPNEPYTSFIADRDYYNYTRNANNELVKDGIRIEKGWVVKRTARIGNKEPSQKVKVGMLTALTTPTGGRTEFKYEPNQVLSDVIWIVNDTVQGMTVTKNTSQKQVTATFEMPYDGCVDFTCTYEGKENNFYNEDMNSRLISVSNGWKLYGLPLHELRNLATSPDLKYVFTRRMTCKKGTYQLTLFTRKPAKLSVSLTMHRATPLYIESLVGGVRIAEIKSPVSTKQFDYTDSSGQSSGRLNRVPVFNGFRIKTYNSIYQPNIPSAYYTAIEYNSAALLPLENTYNNYFMGYKEVTTRVNSNQGTIVERFRFYNEKEPQSFLLDDPGIQIPLNGELLEHETLCDGKIQQKVEKEYRVYNISRIKAYKAHANHRIPFNYYINEQHIGNTFTNTISIENDIADTIYTEKMYNIKNYMPWRETNLCRGNVLKHERRFTIDYPGYYDGFFINQNMITLPVEDLYTTNNRDNERQCHHYHKDGMIKPYKEYVFYAKDQQMGPHSYFTFEGALSLDNQIPQITYLTYDTGGRNTSFRTRGGQNVVLIWGYHHQYLIAQIINATIQQVEKQGINIEAIAGRARPTENDWKQLNDLREKMPQSSVTTARYESILGITLKTDPRGMVTRYTYDDFGRLKETIEVINGEENVLQKMEYKYANEE